MERNASGVCSGQRRLLFQILIVLTVACAEEPPAVAAGSPANFAGTPVVPGGVVTVKVPLRAQERKYVSDSGDQVPPYALATLTVPRNFDPKKAWPVLIVISTSDFKTQNRSDLTRIYGPTARAQGWVAIAGDGPAPPRFDTAGWRLAMTLAALDALNRSFPGSLDWPVASAGYSGGAKRSAFLAPFFSLTGYKVIGIYLTGINVDTLSDGYQQYRPDKAFLHTPIFMSSGESDRVATLQQQWEVKRSIERTGFDRVRLERFRQGHVVKRAHLQSALDWFRKLEREASTR